MSMTIPNNYIKAGNSTQLTLKEWRALVADNCARVRRRLAENPHTPEEILSALAMDHDQEVRVAVGRNPGCPRKVLDRLSKDESIHVRFGLAGDTLIPVEILERLTEDDNPYVGLRAQRTLEAIALENALKESGFTEEAGEECKLGEILETAGLLTRKQLDAYLDLCKEMEAPLGRVLVQAKALPRAVIVAALNCQQLVRRGQSSVKDAIDHLKHVAGSM